MKKTILCAVLFVGSLSLASAQDVKSAEKKCHKTEQCDKAEKCKKHTEACKQVDGATAATAQVPAEKKECCKKEANKAKAECDKEKKECSKSQCEKKAEDKCGKCKKHNQE